MRMQRILVSLLTFALIGLVPIAFASSAEAAKPKRDVSATFKDTGRKVQIKGKIKGGAKLTKILVQVKVGKAKKYRATKTIRTSRTGNYTFVPPFGKTGVSYCYRLVVPGNGKFRKTFVKKYTFGPFKGRPMCVVTSRF